MRENLALSEQLFGVVALSARGLESDAGDAEGHVPARAVETVAVESQLGTVGPHHDTETLASALVYSLSAGLALQIFASLKPFMGTVSRAPTARRCTRPFQCTHSVPEDAGRLRTVANRVVRQVA